MDITLVFFIYGLAFFSMGIALLLESGRSPLLAEATVLLPLAIFGFVHGAHEWMEMFLDKSEWLVFRDSLWLSWLRIGILSISFICLIVFAVRMWEPQKHFVAREVLIGFISLIVLMFSIIFFGFSYRESHIDWLNHVDANVRYLIAVPGAGFAGLALLRQARHADRQDRKEMALGLNVSGMCFLLYALTQLVVPPVDVFPGNWVNTQSFAQITGIPIQVVRAVLAVIITVSMIRAIQVAENERQQQLRYVQQARLDALEQLRAELLKRETMRRDLLRRIVIAQEEERARIARELHDETAQILTAFSLHLATLQSDSLQDEERKIVISNLLDLSRKMSESIRRMVHDLRPAQLDDLGLAAALRYLADEESKRLGLKVELEMNGEPYRLDPLIETVIFRVAQESLTNIARHAKVKQAQVLLNYGVDDVELRVGDKGVGFEVDQIQFSDQGLGLIGMRERVRSVGGKFHLESKLGQGTRVELKLPRNGLKEIDHGEN